MSEPYVVAVILNTNRREDTLECLASLRKSTYRHFDVIVLDNRSHDGSAAAIRAGFPEVRIIELPKNLGYAGNNNFGIAAAVEQGADWVFVLNEDTVLDPACLAALVSAAEDEDIGIVGPTVYHYDEPAVIQSGGGRLGPYWKSIHIAQNEPDVGQLGTARPVEWISGCAIMVRRRTIDRIGALDARYFYYWEETEWCLRAAQADWKIVQVPQARIWHKGVQRDYRPAPSVTYYATRNRFLTLAKHRAPLIAWLNAWFQVIRTLTSWTVRPKWRSMRPHRNAMWRGVVDFLSRRFGGPVRV
jgi:GT2 family glycosyltransferase